MAELDIAQAATIGARAEQQDAAGVARLGTGNGAALLVLADGLGGHADGALASRIVIETFDEAAKGGGFNEHGGRRQALDDAIQEINRRIHDSTDPSDGHRSMASTAVAAIVATGTVRWISVGDSHLYVCRNGRLSKLNADHSQAGLMIRHGYAPDDEAVINARSVLVSALTGRAIEEIDNPAHDVALEPNDVVLLASDGLNTLSDTEIALIIDQMFERGAEAIAKSLIENVTARGQPRQDNTTVVVARVLSIGGVDAKSSEPATKAVTNPTTVPTEVRRTEFPPAEPEPLTAAVVPPHVTAAPALQPEPAKPSAAPERTPLSPAISPSGRETTRPLDAHIPSSPSDPHRRRRLLLKILLTLLVAAAIVSVIVTQTGCCGLP